MPEDYYVVLGVSRGADLQKIKQAYRRVVKQYHPDTSTSSNTSEKFHEITEAYNTLSDTESRRKYDRELQNRQSEPGRSRAPDLISRRPPLYAEIDPLSSAADEFLGGLLPGFFPDFFEKGRGRGKDLFLEVLLTRREANEGGLFPITVPVIEPCRRCRGQWLYCPVCHGKGRVRSERKFSLSIPPHIVHGAEIRLSLEDIGLKNVYVNIIVHIERNHT